MHCFSRSYFYVYGRPPSVRRYVGKTSRKDSIKNISRFLSSAPMSVESASRKLNSSLFNLMKHYEDLIGLTEVKVAQKLVLEAERDFTKTQESRREKQDEIRSVQSQLKEVHAELDKTSRGEDRYLTLLTQEHAIIKRERQLMDDFRRLERTERDCFTLLSNRLRDSHEKERERAEKTKYGSIIGSVACGLIGIAGASWVNKHRFKEIRSIVQDSTEPGRFTAMIEQLGQAIDKQQQKINAFISDLSVMLSGKPALLDRNVADSYEIVLLPKGNQIENESQLDAILLALKSQDERLAEEMNEIKRLIALEHGFRIANEGGVDTNIVYVGPEIRTMLEDTEKHLEWKIKLSTLVQVVAVYGVLALTLPLLYAFFR